MGNSQSDDGPSVDPQVVINLKKGTPFTSEEAAEIFKRYRRMDMSPEGKVGITVKACMDMPEFAGNRFAPDVIAMHTDPETNRIHPRNFMKIATLFSFKTPALTKKEVLFDMFDVDKQKILTHDAMFRLYKLFFSNAISDDHIVALVFSALRHPNLAKDGEVSREEFMQMVTDCEIHERFSVNFLFAQRKHRQIVDMDNVPVGDEDEEEEDEDEDEEYDDDEEEEQEEQANKNKTDENDKNNKDKVKPKTAPKKDK